MYFMTPNDFMIQKIAARSADVFPLTRFLLFLTLVFCIKQKCFITNYGISVTFLLENGFKLNETFSYSTLFFTRRKYDYPKTSLALLMLLAGDIEVNPGPSLHDDINFHSSIRFEVIPLEHSKSTCKI